MVEHNAQIADLESRRDALLAAYDAEPSERTYDLLCAVLDRLAALIGEIGEY